MALAPAAFASPAINDGLVTGTYFDSAGILNTVSCNLKVDPSTSGRADGTYDVPLHSTVDCSNGAPHISGNSTLYDGSGAGAVLAVASDFSPAYGNATSTGYFYEPYPTRQKVYQAHVVLDMPNSTGQWTTVQNGTTFNCVGTGSPHMECWINVTFPTADGEAADDTFNLAVDEASAHVTVSPSVFNILQAIGGGTYSPLDPSDGDPGGSTATAGVDTTVLGPLAAAFVAAPTKANALAFLSGISASGPLVQQVTHDTVGGVICHKYVAENTVPHTKKTAMVGALVSCNAPVNISSYISWFSLDSGALFDQSGPGGAFDEKGVINDLFVATTTGGRRGHRLATFCSTETRRGSAAGSCLTPPTLAGRGV